ncbi:hypothetical protein [Bacteroides sp. 51]|uniref:hypothetical protein n=1 Tax=Bacteroides sp. 51 TaxID=2302938 RepID=UPI0013D828C9|nr:hypothetical protein [Bacteroides sp. 51]NDV80673.1 hypothetical protein [Bacteroides sp. 51]
MGDIVQVLIVIGIIIFAVVRKAIGNGEEGKQQRPKMNIPQRDREMEDMEYERTNPAPFLSYDYDLPPSAPKTAEHTPRRQTQKSEIPPPPPIQEESSGNQEFNIESAEEVRRGIIWSEILNRKY